MSNCAKRGKMQVRTCLSRGPLKRTLRTLLGYPAVSKIGVGSALWILELATYRGSVMKYMVGRG